MIIKNRFLTGALPAEELITLRTQNTSRWFEHNSLFPDDDEEDDTGCHGFGCSALTGGSTWGGWVYPHWKMRPRLLCQWRILRHLHKSPVPQLPAASEHVQANLNKWAQETWWEKSSCICVTQTFSSSACVNMWGCDPLIVGLNNFLFPLCVCSPQCWQRHYRFTDLSDCLAAAGAPTQQSSPWIGRATAWWRVTVVFSNNQRLSFWISYKQYTR